MKIVHFCVGLEEWNGVARNAREFVKEEMKDGVDSHLTNDLDEIAGKIDVVHIHGAWLPILWKVAKRAKAIGAKLIIMPEASYDPLRRAYHGWKKKLVAPWEHRMLARADVVMAVCEAERDWIDGYHPGLNIEVTDLKRFFDLSKAPDLAARLQELRDRKRLLRLLYLGRRHPLKGVEYLVQAVREINEGDKKVSLHEVSDKFGAELEKEWDWTDILVLPTLTEDFGRVVAEALERGKPVITTDGAPAWSPDSSPIPHPPSLVYLKGYREGTDATRIRLLKDALIEFVG